MTAQMANLPLASSADKFLVFPAGSKPKSPAKAKCSCDQRAVTSRGCNPPLPTQGRGGLHPPATRVPISREARRVPEANWRLNVKLVLDRAQRRNRVSGPGATGGASEALLEEHAEDCHDDQSSVGKIGRQILGLLRRHAGGESIEAEVARSSLGSRGLVLRKLAEASVGEDLTPASCWHLVDGGQAVRDVAELQTSGRRPEAR